MSVLPPSRISSVSRNPAVQIRPVRATLRSRIALVATVVPQEKAAQRPSSVCRSMPRRVAIRSSPAKMPSAMSPGVVEDL